MNEASDAATIPSRYVRPFGGVVAIALAAGSLLLLYLVAAIPAVESAVHVRYVLGRDGFLIGQGWLAILLAWAAGPVAAGASGWLFARATARRERLAGAWMGLVTYFLALLLASLIPDLMAAINHRAEWSQSIFQAVVGAPLMAVVAGSVLAPLFFCCLVAGSTWAWIVRRFASASADDPVPNTIIGGLAVPGLVFVGSLTILGWLVFGSVFAFLTGDGGPFVD